MRDTHLDQLLNQFFANEFQGFTEKISLPDNLLSTPVPVVEVPLDIDTDKLLDLVKDLSVEDMVRKTYPYEDVPRFANWKIKLLWNNGYENTLLGDVYYKKTSSPIPALAADTAVEPIKQHLLDLGVDAKLCMLSVFEPNGYLRPHRDIGLNPTPLNYFWLPLNNPTGSELRIYPYGNVTINAGSIYLLNQENFVHSVVNYSNEHRYVLVGHLNNISTEFKQQILNSILKQYDQNI